MDERLIVDTPEQVALELPIAGIGSRAIAAVIDTLLQGVIILMTGIVVVIAAGAMLVVVPQATALLPAVLVVVLFLVYWLYFAAFEILWDGRTPGKRVAAIRVIKDTGRPITVYEGLTRNILRVIDFLPVFYGVGVAIMMCNRNSRRLGDFVAGTIVVHDQVRDEPAPHVPDVATGYSPLPDNPDNPLRAAELVLIEAYLARRFELDPLVRDERARQIVARVTAGTGLKPADGQPLDAFLETVASDARTRARFKLR